MKSRFTHLAMIVLGAAGVALGLLEKVPKYATAAGAGLLLLAEVRKAFGLNIDITKPPVSIVLALLACAGISCATVQKTATTCEATASQAQKILEMLGSSTVASVAIAAVDALKFGCATTAEVDAYIEAHEHPDAGVAPLASIDPLDSLRLANAYAWRTAHPK